ncbi:MAG: PAS domain-containing protein [Bacteroidetes bacterium]|nr:PAS domain-containing protein [Bacteroidota bacterium]
MKQLQKLELIDTLFNHSAEGIIVVDILGNIRLANTAVARMLNYTTSELATLNVDDLVPDMVRSKHQQHRDNFHKHSHSRSMGVGIDLFAKKKAETCFLLKSVLVRWR